MPTIATGRKGHDTLTSFWYQ